jgi:hypothetical protein
MIAYLLVGLEEVGGCADVCRLPAKCVGQHFCNCRPITGHFHRQFKRDIMQTRCKARANVYDETVANAARLVTD